MKTIFFALVCTAACLTPLATTAATGDVSTWIGRVAYGNGQTAAEAFFDFPYDFERTKRGGWVIADTSNHMIRKITPSDVVRRVAGSGSAGNVLGAAADAEFAFPKGVALASNGRIVVADTDNNAIKLIDDGRVTLLTTAVSKPQDVIVKGKVVYIADTGNGALKRIKLGGSGLTTLTSQLETPTKLALSADGSQIYIADEGRRQIKAWSLSQDRLTTIAGSGKSGHRDDDCDQARFQYPGSIAIVGTDQLLVADRSGGADYVKQITLGEDCSVETVYTDIGMSTVNAPRILAVAGERVFMLLAGYGFIDRLSLTDFSLLKRFAGADRYQVKDRKPVLTGRPKHLLLSPDGEWVYLSENNRIRRFRLDDPADNAVVAGSVVDAYAVSDTKQRRGERVRFSDVPSFAISPNGRQLYVVDRNNNRIRRVDIETGQAFYLTGAGGINDGGGVNGLQDGEPCPDTYDLAVADCAYLSGPIGSVLSEDGKYLYVTDSANNAIRRVTVRGETAGRVITLAGNGTAGYRDATGAEARFSAPIGIALNADGTALYIADRDNHRIRKLDLSTRAVTTLAGAGRNGYREGSFSDAVFSYPDRLLFDDGTLYFSEIGTHRIRALDLETETTRLIAGSSRGSANGVATAARFHNPVGMLVAKGQLLVADSFNDQVRMIDL